MTTRQEIDGVAAVRLNLNLGRHAYHFRGLRVLCYSAAGVRVGTNRPLEHGDNQAFGNNQADLQRVAAGPEATIGPEPVLKRFPWRVPPRSRARGGFVRRPVARSRKPVSCVTQHLYD